LYEIKLVLEIQHQYVVEANQDYIDQHEHHQFLLNHQLDHKIFVIIVYMYSKQIWRILSSIEIFTFPQPEVPTSAVVWPDWAVNVSPLRTETSTRDG